MIGGRHHTIVYALSVRSVGLMRYATDRAANVERDVRCPNIPTSPCGGLLWTYVTFWCLFRGMLRYLAALEHSSLLMGRAWECDISI